MKSSLLYFFRWLYVATFLCPESTSADAPAHHQGHLRSAVDSLHIQGIPHPSAMDRFIVKKPNGTLDAISSEVFVIDTAIVWSTADTTRHRYSFSPAGKVTYDLTERWLEGQWMDAQRVLYSYDTHGHLVSRLAQIWSEGEWVNSSLQIIAYDGNGNMLSQLSQEWSNSQWVNGILYTATFDANDACLASRLNSGRIVSGRACPAAYLPTIPRETLPPN